MLQKQLESLQGAGEEQFLTPKEAAQLMRCQRPDNLFEGSVWRYTGGHEHRAGENPTVTVLPEKGDSETAAPEKGKTGKAHNRNRGYPKADVRVRKENYMEDLMLGIATNCLTAAMILWETTDLQCFPATLAITAAAAFLICARGNGQKK